VFELTGILDALARDQQLLEPPGSFPATITGVADHTDDVIPGSLFCAVRGTERDGHDFLTAASERGATAFLVTEKRGLAGEVHVKDGRIAAALAAAAFFGHPAHSLTLIGVTGTNGKSTTVHVTRHLLNVNVDVGAIGTLGAYDGHGDALYTEKLTTPGPIALHKAFAELVDRGTRCVVLEVSSHALHQKRLHGVTLAAAIFTNFSRDHLDYHATWQEYVAAKLSLVNHLGSQGWQIVNADDRAWSDLPLPDGQRRLTFGIREQADVAAEVVNMSGSGSELRLSMRPDRSEAGVPGSVYFPLLGEFNVSNALAAAACASTMGLLPDEIVRRLASVPQVPGRMERIGPDGYLVLRDYSHTPDALERASRAARPLTSGRLMVLFGCGGDRDRGKRIPMGKIAAAEADVAIVTSDNPRTEDPDRIIRDIEEGMQGKAYVRIVDRREAILRAVEMMRPEDCLLLAGKGHETYQVRGTRRVPFDERLIVEEAFRLKGGS
jgi:UDP-N-acetylmuramoyl-L-alanyl-D-glutamate--2,6-diaminopimelate ligase